MRRVILYAIIACTFVGCAAGLRVDQIAKIDSSQKVLALMNETRWNVKVRRALAREGFQVKRFMSVKEVEVKDGKRTETYNQADARYGLTIVPGEIVDWCPGGRAKKFGDFALEVTDLRTNDIVLVVEKGGWSDTCVGMFGGLFPDLAKAMREHW